MSKDKFVSFALCLCNELIVTVGNIGVLMIIKMGERKKYNIYALNKWYIINNKSATN